MQAAYFQTSPHGTNMDLQLPPHSLEAEQAVLGAALCSGRALEVLIESLAAGDFYLPAHRLIFDAIAYLHERGEPVDLVTVPEELRRREQLEPVGGNTYLLTLEQSFAAAAHADYYARTVAGKAVLRRLIDSLSTAIGEAYRQYDLDGEPLEPEAILERAEAAVLGVRLQQGGVKTSTAAELFLDLFGSALDGAGELIPRGVPTGFTKLDLMTRGLQAGELFLVAGRASMGKTEVCLHIARAAAGSGVPTLVYSLEMPEDQIGQRLMATEAGLALLVLAAGNLPAHKQRDLLAAVERLRDLPLHICDHPEMTVSAIRSHTCRLQRERGIGLVVIDQLQCIQRPEKAENENVAFTRVAYALKAMARSLNVPVILQCQLSRLVERREDKRPLLSDLRDSGSLEQACDRALMLYRGSYYQNEPGSGPFLTELHLRKNRITGTTGMVKTWFRPESHSFTEVDSLHEEPGDWRDR